MWLRLFPCAMLFTYGKNTLYKLIFLSYVRHFPKTSPGWNWKMGEAGVPQVDI